MLGEVDLHRKGMMTMRRVVRTARMMEKIRKNRRLKIPPGKIDRKKERKRR